VEEMKRYRQRKRLKAMSPVPCSSAVSESSGGKKSKAAPSIQKKERSCEVNRRQCQTHYMTMTAMKKQLIMNGT